MKKIIAIACMAWIALAGAWADNISAGDITLPAGGTKTVNISLTNTESNLVSFQIDLTLPEGISINKAGCSLSNRISDPDQELAIGKQGNNVYRIASTSFALTPISGTSGTLLTLSLTASANSEGGTATLSNIRFFTSNSERVTMSDASFNIGMAITFADANVKALCVQNWDTNGDCELSEAEAAAVTDLGTVFKGNTTITSFDELQYFTGLTSIADEAFRDCNGLASVNIPESVTSIGKWAFFQCNKLTSVTIPNSVTSIGKSAFYGCSSLTSMTIPNSVTSIGEAAFSHCSSLTAITVENGNSYYVAENGVLFNKNKTSLLCFPAGKTQSTYAIPESVTRIFPYAFDNCRSLTAVTIPNSVTSIGNYAFYLCTGLTSVTIPSGVTVISDNMFQDCRNLTSVTIPNSVTSIGGHAFYRCLKLTSVTIPSSVTSIGNYAFQSCDNLTSVTVEIETPLTIGGYTFTNRANATLYVPAGCKAAYQAADYWKEFKEIVAPSPIITFADANVKALCVQNWDTDGDAELSEDEAAAVTYLGEVFKGNKNITSFDELQYFTGLTNIGDNAFNYCSGMTSVTFPNSLTSIGKWSFQYCSGLTSIIIPNSVKSIGVAAFHRCNGLTSVTIPESVTSIDYAAFSDCTGLTSIIVENGNNYYISEDGVLFDKDKKSLLCFPAGKTQSTYTIPESVTKIYAHAFERCSNLTFVTIPDNVTSIGKFAFRASGLTSVTIPNSVTTIGERVFLDCSSLTSATIPNSVTTIGLNAFGNCTSLTSVSIPSSVTSIGESAFNGCTNLTSVTVEMETPLTITENTFTNRANATLYVPAGCKAAYEAADYWKEFKQIMETAELYAVPENFTPADNQEIQATASVKLLYGNGGGWSQSYYDPIFEEFPYRIRGSENPNGGYTPGLVRTLPDTGTFYSFTPSQDGYIDFAVGIFANKSFYIAGLSDAYNYSGDAVLTDINGNVVTLNSDYQVSEQFTGTVRLGIKKGETYLMFCRGSKMFLYGFKFTPGEVIEDTGTPHEPQAWDFTSYLSEADKTNIAADGNWTIYDITDNETGVKSTCYEYTWEFENAVVKANNTELELTEGLRFNTGASKFQYYDGERLNHGGSGHGPIIPKCAKGDIVKIRYKINEGGRGFQVNYTELTEGTLIGETEGIYEATLTVKRKVDVIFSSVRGTDILALAVNTDLPKLKNPVTITADSYTIEYGDELPEFTFTTEGSELEGTPVIICDATASSPAGTYDITIDASNVANSQVTIVNGTLTINKAKLTASVGEYTIQEGDDIPEFDISYSGFKNNEDKSVLTTEPVTTCEATSASPAGTYAITLAGGEAANYDISNVAGTLTVEENTAPTDVSQIDNVVYPLEKEASAGGQAVLSFNLKNTDLIRGFEFDLYLPDGVTAVESDGDIEASLTPERMPGRNSHSLSVSEQPDGSLHFLCSAFDNKNYATGDSEVMTLRIKLSKDMPLKEYAIVMRNVLLGKTNINQYYETEKVISRLIVDEYMLGDVNGDGNVNLTDYIWTANYIHKNASEEYILQAGDINGDGNINLLDYIGIANIIHYGSPSGEATAGAKAAVFEEADEGGALDPQ